MAAMQRPLVNADWLKQHLHDPELVVLDASWYLPAAGRDPEQEYLDGHIPGARRFDFDGVIKDHASSLPHMLPDAASFEAQMRGLGLSAGSRVVCYDGMGLFAAPRCWWMLRTFGHDDVTVLDGGLPAWTAAGGALESGPEPEHEAGDFKARLRPELVRSAEQVYAASRSGAAYIVDARSAGRFAGAEPEPRAGLRSGHIPGSLNLSFDRVLRQGGMLPKSELRHLLAETGLATDKPIIASCGSGVTSAVLALAIAVAEMGDAAIYDGSWTEWGGRDDLPVAIGP